MPYKSKTHDENRHKVCLICTGKGQGLRDIKESQIQLIADHVFGEYERYKDMLPCAICNSCRIMLYSYKNPDETKRLKLPKTDYASLVNELENVRNVGRACNNNKKACLCTICNKATSNLACIGNKLTKKRVGRPSLNPECERKVTGVIKICTRCKGEIKRGKRHPCSKAAKLHNVQRLLSPRSKELVTSNVIKDKMRECKSKNVQVGTRGKPIKISRLTPNNNISESIKPLVNNQSLLDMQTECNFSDRVSLKVAQSIRQGGCKVEPNFRQALSARGKMLDDWYEVKLIPQTIKDPDDPDNKITVQKHAVLCKDVNAYITFLEQKRDSNETSDVIYRIGIDGGQKFLKVCLNIVDKSMPASPRLSRSAKKRFADSGVKRLHILGLVHDTEESYENVKEILDNLGIDAIDMCLAADLKVCNVCAGLQNHSATYPCTWCEAKSPFDKTARLRTFGRMRECARKYAEDGSNKKNAPKFYSCINAPLFSHADNVELLDIIVTPPLHLLLGTANHLLDKLNEEWGQNRAYEWASARHIVRKGYQGGKMEGNHCKKLLRKAPALKRVLPRNLKKYAIALMSFNKVVHACFGNTLDKDYKLKIDEFKMDYLNVGISVTPKVHCVFEHVSEFISRRGMSLGKYAEQASESVHCDFLKEWKRYACDISHPTYPDKIRSCVVKYNSKHV